MAPLIPMDTHCSEEETIDDQKGMDKDINIKRMYTAHFVAITLGNMRLRTYF